MNSVSSTDLWHYRLGHLSFSRLQLTSDPIVQKQSYSINEKFCKIFPLAKFHQLPFPVSSHSSSRIFELIHYDLWGPCSTAAHDGSMYFLTIVDDFSRTT